MKKLLILLMFLGMAGQAWGTTYYVDSSVADTNAISAVCDFATYNHLTGATTDGSDCVYATLVDVILLTLAAGDNVLFRKGKTFVGTATFGTLAFTGLTGTSGAGNITFGAYATDDAATALPIIDAASPATSSGFSLTASTYVTITNMDFRNSAANGIALIGAGNSYVTIDGVSATYNGARGITIAGGAGHTVKNSTVSYNTKEGIAGASMSGALIQANIVSYNCITYTAGEYPAGIKFTGTTTSIFERNVSSYHDNGEADASGISGSGIWLDVDANGNIVRFNATHHNNSVGIYIETSSNNSVYYNVSYLNGTGIWLEGRHYDAVATGNTFYNNTLWANRDWGIMIQDGIASTGATYDNTFKNNISVGTTAGPNLRIGGDAINLFNTLDKNSFGTASANFMELGWGSFYSLYSDLEAWYDGLLCTASGVPRACCTGSGTGTCTANSIESTPTVINSAGNDYRLAAGSSAINQGVSVSLTTDYSGNAIQGLPDIGAYEYLFGPLLMGSFAGGGAVQ